MWLGAALADPVVISCHLGTLKTYELWSILWFGFLGKLPHQEVKSLNFQPVPMGEAVSFVHLTVLWSQVNLNFLSNKKSMKSLVLRPRCPSSLV